MTIGSAIAVLAALAAPAWAQEQPPEPGNREPSGYVERVDTPEGTVTIVRPGPHPQPSPRRAVVNPDPVPPPPQTRFLTDQVGTECRSRRRCSEE
jgi:hypothetical protein